jgi:hypothetical protein
MARRSRAWREGSSGNNGLISRGVRLGLPVMPANHARSSPCQMHTSLDALVVGRILRVYHHVRQHIAIVAFERLRNPRGSGSHGWATLPAPLSPVDSSGLGRVNRQAFGIDPIGKQHRVCAWPASTRYE